MMHKILIFLTGLTLSCSSPHHSQSDSNLDSVGRLSGTLLRQPPWLDGKKLRELAAALGTAAGGYKSQPSNLGKSQFAIQSLYAKAVTQMGGVRREQGEEVLRSILMAESKACGAVSCSNILGLSPVEVGPFMDNLLVQAGGQPKSPVRDTLVASLTPAAAFRSPESPQEIVATIFHANPLPLPMAQSAPQEILKSHDIAKKVSPSVISAIQNYTIGGYQISRRVETMSRQAAEKDGISPSIYDLWKKRSEIINRGLASLPPIKQNIYRGLNMVPMDTLARWVTKWRKKEPIYLGPGDQPAMTSATWDINAAKNFFVVGSMTPSRHVPHLSVLFEITDHRGVGIQSISRMPGEHEVLIPAGNRFQIEDIAPLEGMRGTIYIRVRGVSLEQDKPALREAI